MAIAGYDYIELPKSPLSVKLSKICSFNLNDCKLVEFLRKLCVNLPPNKRRSFLGEIKKHNKNILLTNLDEIYLIELLNSRILLSLIYIPPSLINSSFCSTKINKLSFTINNYEITFYEYNFNGLESF